MGAIVAAATHAPITAILIIFELTGDYQIILPLMISCIIGTLLSSRIQRASIYTLKLLRRGVEVQGGRAVNVLQRVPARAVMREDVVTVGPTEGIVPLLGRFIDHPGSTLFVTAPGRELLGLVALEQIRPVLQNPSALEGVAIAQDVMLDDGFPRVEPQESLATVMRVMEGYRGELPVVERGRLVGTIWPGDVIERYNAEVFRRDMAAGMGAAVEGEGMRHVAPGQDAVVAEVIAPPAFAGRTVGELDIRRRCGVSVLVVKRVGPEGERLQAVTGADFRFRDGDLLLVLGPEEEVHLLERGILRVR
jgi:CIC family chloride channel protein